MTTDARGPADGPRTRPAADHALAPGGRRGLRRAWAPSLERLSDEELVGRARAGAPEPFEVLWRRHADAGRRVASRFTRASDPDDLVQEAYLRIYSAVSRGKGPDGPFRPYLYQSIRNIAITWAARPQTDSVDLMADLSDGTDISETVLEGTVTATAFRSLPSRWQEVLWYSEVEGLEPADIGPLLGLKASAVSALAYRAREGLRRAWLQAHVASAGLPADCRWSAEHMGDANRGALSGTARTRFDEHVGGCARCTIVVAEVDEVSSRLGLVLVPLLVGLPWATFETMVQPAGAATSATAASRATPTAGPTGSPSAGHHRPASSLRRPRPAALGPASSLRRPRPAALVAALAVGLVAVSTAVAVGSGWSRLSEPPQPAGATAAPGTPPDQGPSSTPPAPAETKDAEGGVGSPDDAPTLELPADPGPLDIPSGEVPDPPQAPAVAEPLPPIPTLPPLAPVPPVVNPVPVPEPEPEQPVAPAPPTAPTIAGPPTGTALTTFPTVSGTADPGVTVVVTTAAGDVLATTVADDAGAWTGPVCQDATTGACVADGDALTVLARARDEDTGLESDESPALTWTFDRPTLTAPTDGAVVELSANGDVQVQLEGTAGQYVQVSIDGSPTGRYHLMPQPEALLWLDATPGTHTLSVRYVTVQGSGAEAEVTGFGPYRTSTVTVTPHGSEPGAAPEDGSAAGPGARPEDDPESGPEPSPEVAADSSP